MTSPLETGLALTRETGRVRVLFEGHEIADSDDILVLHEGERHPVRYFPRKDVWMMFLRQTDTVPHAAPKGDTTYFTIYRDQKIIERAAWTHNTPASEMHALAGRVAFFPEHVDFQAAGHSAAQSDAEAQSEQEREERD